MISKIYFSEVDQCEGLKLLEKAKYQIERSTEKGFERENDAKRLRERERERKRLTLRKRDGEKGLKRENDAKITHANSKVCDDFLKLSYEKNLPI